MIDFQIGSENYGGPFRYLGRRAILPTQTLRAAGLWIFSTVDTNFSIAVGIDCSIRIIFFVERRID